MAEVSFLHLPEYDHDLFLEEILTVDSLSFWAQHDRDGGAGSGFELEDDMGFEIGVESGVGLGSERKNQVNFIIDLFNQRVEESRLMGSRESVLNDGNESTFGVTGENYDVGLNNLGVELGLGLEQDDCGVGIGNDDDDDDDCNFGGFAVSDCGDDFYIARRRENVGRDCNEGSSRVVWIESDSDEDVEGISKVLMGMRVNSDVEEEDFGVENVNDDDLSVPLCWDSFHLEVDVEEEDRVEVNNDFEWEEVDDGVDEREVLSFVADPEDEEEGSISVLNFAGPEEDVERGRRFSNLDWEVLLNVDNLDRNPEMENEGGPYFGDHDDFIYTAEYEMMFGQFADDENASFGRPPASKAVIEKLPLVVTTEEDVVNEKSLCAVCKDHIEVGEEGKQLPCSHRYHGDCIIPWLGIRNTCPVCRFELLTDDPDYEQRRARSSSRVV